MFLSKILFKVLLLLRLKEYQNSLIVIILSVAGCYLKYHYEDYNYAAFFQSLVFLLFIFVGYKMRNRTVPLFAALLSLFIYVFLALQLDWKSPSLCAIITFSTRFLPVYIVMSLTGTTIVYYLSKCINSNGILEFLGRNSIVFYLTHISFLSSSSILLKDYIVKKSMSASSAIFIISFMVLGSLCWGSFWSWFLNRKRLRWVLGK